MRRWACAALACILAGCGQGNVGGGGIEIPNGLSVTVTATGETALRGVKVRLLARDSWTTRTQAGLPVALDSATTDANGQVSFRLPGGEGYWVEALSGNLGQRAQVEGPGQLSLPLGPLSTLSGNVVTGPASRVFIRLGGSDRTTITDATGAFRFDSLPQGTWNLVAQPGRVLAPLKTVDLGLSPLSVQGLADDTTTVVLDDFSDGTDVWNLQGLFGNGYWWIADNSTPLRTVFGIDGAWQAVQVDSATGNRYISFSVNSAGMPSSPWADAGLDLGSTGAPLPELSHLGSVRLQCRGTGSWSLSLVEKATDSIQSWKIAVPLGSAWSTLHLASSRFTGPAGQSWSSAPRRIHRLYFQTNGSGTLEIREIALEGASLSDWGK